MKERPIIFDAESVLAILEGRKTQTRRVVKPGHLYEPTDEGVDILWATGQIRCPYGEPGDGLWVKEAWRVASRILLRIKGVRVERLQDITPADCEAEGYPDDGSPSWEHYAERFSLAWDELNAKRGYPFSSNPWVWVIGFEESEP